MMVSQQSSRRTKTQALVSSKEEENLGIVKRALCHRLDSMQVTDYIANYFFLNLRISRKKIENLK